jgi:hypothetical protein
MAKCGHCRQRKAKRACPARRDDLCPLCCGQLRNREVACPPACRYLAEHAPYQEQRLLRRKVEAPAGSRTDEDDLFKDERLAWLAVHIETPLRDWAVQRPEWSDGDAILALEYAKDKLVQGRNRIFVPGAGRPAGNDAGEAVMENMERCRFEKSVILTAGASGYTTEEKLRVLDRLILAAKSSARGDFKGRSYLDRVAASFERIERGARSSKLIAVP